MADFFSEHYTTTTSGTSIDDPRIKVAAGLSNAKMRYKRASVTTTTATAGGDGLRFFTLKSSDRIQELLLSHTADASTSADGDLGVYDINAGSVVDLDLFGDILVSPMDDITATISRVNVFTGGALELEDVGKPLYELVDEGLGTSTFDDDPLKEWDIVLTVANETGIVATEYVLEVYYTSAGA